MINRLALLEGDDGASGAWGGGWDDDAPSAPNSAAFQPDELEDETFDDLGVSEIDHIRDLINDIKSSHQRIQKIEQEYVKMVDQKEMSGALREVDTLVQQSVMKSKEVRVKLDALKEKNEEFESHQEVNSTKAVWRNNQLRSLTQAVKKATGDVQSAADKFHSAVSNRVVRLHCIANDVDQNKVSELKRRAEANLYEMQEEAFQMVQKFGVSDATIDKIAELEEQNRDMREIEEGVKQLNQIFEEMATMVYDQGAMLDEIAHNVAQTRDHVAAAKQEIVKAEGYQKSVRKKKFCIALCCIVILGILILILAKFLG